MTKKSSNEALLLRPLESLRIYKTILFSTWLVFIAFSVALGYYNAWFSFSVVVVGTLLVSPALWQLAQRGNPAWGRLFYVLSSNFYVIAGSMGINNHIQAELFFVTLSISSIIVFDKEEKNYSYVGLVSIVFSWFILRIDPPIKSYRVPGLWIICLMTYLQLLVFQESFYLL